MNDDIAGIPDEAIERMLELIARSPGGAAAMRAALTRYLDESLEASRRQALEETNDIVVRFNQGVRTPRTFTNSGQTWTTEGTRVGRCVACQGTDYITNFEADRHTCPMPQVSSE